MTLQILHPKGQSNVPIARTLGGTEGAVRSHMRRQQATATEGRGDHSRWGPAARGGYRPLGWPGRSRPTARRPGQAGRHVLAPQAPLVAEHGSEGSHREALPFIRDRYSAPRLRSYRRVETPPGVPAKLDWEASSSLGFGEGQGGYSWYDPRRLDPAKSRVVRRVSG